MTHASFHLVGKQALTIDKLINLVNGCTKTGETSFKTFTLISSAPLAFDDNKLSIKFSFLLYCYDRNIELSDKIINGWGNKLLKLRRIKRNGWSLVLLMFLSNNYKILINMFAIAEVSVSRVPSSLLSSVTFVDFWDLVRDISAFQISFDCWKYICLDCSREPWLKLIYLSCVGKHSTITTPHHCPLNPRFYLPLPR